MVGGKIIGVVRKTDGTTLVNVQDKSDTLAIRVFHGPHNLSVWDSIWWQGNRAMWTPKENAQYDVDDPRGGKCGKDWDIQLERRGYSH